MIIETETKAHFLRHQPYPTCIPLAEHTFMHDISGPLSDFQKETDL